MKYISVFNFVFNLKHTKIKRCVFACVYEGWGARNPPGKVWEPLVYMITNAMTLQVRGHFTIHTNIVLAPWCI